MVTRSVRFLLDKITQLSRDIEELDSLYRLLTKSIKSGQARAISARLAMRRSAFKHYHNELSDKGKGNVLNIKFSHGLTIYQATLTNLTPIDAQELIKYKYGHKVKFLEIEDIPTQIKKAGL